MGVAYYFARGTIYQKHLTDIIFYMIIGGMLITFFMRRGDLPSSFYRETLPDTLLRGRQLNGQVSV
jgi:hypothetical protein